MEVDHDLSTVSLTPTSGESKTSSEAPPSDVPHQTQQNKKNKKKKQIYNRDSVRIDEFLGKDTEEINAKQMRVLLPAMFQKLQYPDKDVTNTKVKGLWEKGNRPGDFPQDVEFQDPNNEKKMKQVQMKKMFEYLKMKLLKMPEYEKISAHLHQIDSNIQDLSDKYAQLNKQTPKDVNFQILGENHDVKQAFGVEQGLMQPAQTMKMNVSGQEVYPDNLIGPEMIAIDIGNENLFEELGVVNFPDDDAMYSELCESANTPATENEESAALSNGNRQQAECKAFVDGICSPLHQPVTEFRNTFANSSLVLETLNKLIADVINPLITAGTAGDKTKCLELSKYSTNLLDIMKRSTFLGSQYDPIDELNKLTEEYCSAQVISEDSMLPVAQEVQIYDEVITDQPSVTPQMLEAYLSTSNGLDACTTQSCQLLEDNFPKKHITNEVWSSVLDLRCGGLNGLQMMSDRQEFNERDLGITQHFQDEDVMRSTDHLIDNFGEFQSLSVLTDASDQQFIELAPDVQFSVNMQCEPVIDELNNSLMEYLTKDCLETCQESPSINPVVPPPVNNIPLIVSEVAEMPDVDAVRPKRKRKAQNKDASVRAHSIAGKKQMPYRRSKQRE